MSSMKAEAHPSGASECVDVWAIFQREVQLTEAFYEVLSGNHAHEREQIRERVAISLLQRIQEKGLISQNDRFIPGGIDIGTLFHFFKQWGEGSGLGLEIGFHPSFPFDRCVFQNTKSGMLSFDFTTLCDIQFLDYTEQGSQSNGLESRSAEETLYLLVRSLLEDIGLPNSLIMVCNNQVKLSSPSIAQAITVSYALRKVEIGIVSYQPGDVLSSFNVSSQRMVLR